MKRIIRLFVAFLVFGGGAFVLSKFFDENADSLQLQLLGWRTRSVGVGVLVTFVFFAGVFVGLFLTFTATLSKSIEASRLKRENLALQKILEEKTHSSSSKI
jgi:uncharacterized integral membrane protein